MDTKDSLLKLEITWGIRLLCIYVIFLLRKLLKSLKKVVVSTLVTYEIPRVPKWDISWPNYARALEGSEIS